MSWSDATLSLLVQRAVSGEQQAIARLLTITEHSLERASEVLAAVDGLPRKGLAIGFAGSPGVGKSSLIAALVLTMIEKDCRVAVLANDPTGYHTGGALLGDRVRMNVVARDPRVFIRSVAARDPLRSLSATTYGSVELLARIGFDYVLIETVGTGQSDIATSHVADTTVLVMAPGSGDDVQAMKSGVMELADILVLNKSETPQAGETLRMLRRSMDTFKRNSGRIVPVVPVSAAEHTGIDELLTTIFDIGGRTPDLKRALAVEMMLDLVSYEVTRRLREYLPTSKELAAKMNEIAHDDTDVLAASLELAGEVLSGIDRRTAELTGWPPDAIWTE